MRKETMCFFAKQKLWDTFAWKLADYVGRLAAHGGARIIVREGLAHLSDNKKRGATAIQHGHGQVTPMGVGECVWFQKSFSKHGPRTVYPLSVIDGKVESLCGYTF
ncbi:hypothetical protein Tco_0604334 [Tanacetum coccineum]